LGIAYLEGNVGETGSERIGDGRVIANLDDGEVVVFAEREEGHVHRI